MHLRVSLLTAAGTALGEDRMSNRIVEIAFFGAWLAGLGFSQGLSSLTGTVTDPTGAIIPDAKVSLADTGTGSQRNTVCDPQGRYAFLQVQPGTYRLTAQAPGFVDVVRENIQLLVNTPTTADLTFQKV